MKKLFDFTRKLIISDPKSKDFQGKGFSAYSTWFNALGFAVFSTWIAWLSEPTLKAWREADRVIAVHGFDHNAVIVLAFLLLVAAFLFASMILAGACYKAIIDRMQ